MQTADVIVFGTPAYFYSCTGQLKVLFDRTVAIYPDLPNKQYYYLIAQGDDSKDTFAGTIKSLDGFLDCYEGSKLKGMVAAPGMEWVLAGEGLATVKIDGTCCAVIDGKFYKRYDAKKGKTPPLGAIPCCDPDPVTGHWPHWLLVDPADQGSNWHLAAYYNVGGTWLSDGTYEAIGPHFQSNPYALTYDCLEKHGKRIVKDAPRTFEGLREYLRTHNIEGLVFWKDGEPQCKIKRSDFGFKWPDKTLRVEF